MMSKDQRTFIEKIVDATDKFDQHSGLIPEEKWYSVFDEFFRAELQDRDVDDSWLQRQKKKFQAIIRGGTNWGA